MSKDKNKKVCDYCKEEKDVTQTCLKCGTVYCSCIKLKNAPVNGYTFGTPTCPKCGSTKVTF